MLNENLKYGIFVQTPTFPEKDKKESPFPKSKRAVAQAYNPCLRIRRRGKKKARRE